MKLIRSKQHLEAIFMTRDGSTMLQLPPTTRFATYFYTLESLIKNKIFLSETLHCDAFERWMSELMLTDMATRDEVQAMKDALGSPALWRWFEDASNVMKPIVYGLRGLDSKAPTMGKAWMHFWRIE